MEGEGDLKKKRKNVESDVDALAYAKYPKLSDAEIKVLAVDSKWLIAVSTQVYGAIDQSSQALSARIGELAERYQMALPETLAKVVCQENAVTGHLMKLGFSWR